MDECWVINLESRPERLQAFTTGLLTIGGWPFPPVATLHAFDGRSTEELPELWQNHGQYGCYMSHLIVLSGALRRGANSVMVFEDDAELLPDFASRFMELNHLVPNWEVLSLGGEHLRRPVPIHGALRVRMAVRTHAYVVRGHALYQLVEVLKRFHGAYAHDWEQAMAMQWFRWYAPVEWFVAQCEGFSDITGKEEPRRQWT